MSVEWDTSKAAANLEKHGIDFADAALALEDELALTIEDPGHEDERRFVSVCMDPCARVLVVVFTWRGAAVRIISARKATSRERRQYEGGI